MINNLINFEIFGEINMWPVLYLPRIACQYGQIRVEDSAKTTFMFSPVRYRAPLSKISLVNPRGLYFKTLWMWNLWIPK